MLSKKNGMKLEVEQLFWSFQGYVSSNKIIIYNIMVTSPVKMNHIVVIHDIFQKLRINAGY